MLINCEFSIEDSNLYIYNIYILSKFNVMAYDYDLKIYIVLQLCTLKNPGSDPRIFKSNF